MGRRMRGLATLDPGALAALERRIAVASRRRALTYTRDDGTTQVIRLVAAPAILPRGDVAYLRALCVRLGGAFRKVAAARAAGDPDVVAALPLARGEDEWFALAPPGVAPMVARWDLNIDPAHGGARCASLFEMNGSAIGGIHYGPESSAIVKDALIAACLAAAGLVVPTSMREIWLGLLDGHLGRRAALVWLEDATWETGITEGPSLAAALRRGGRGAAVADPRALELSRRGAIMHRGRAIDLIYRSIEIRDFVAMERAHAPLSALREAFRRGRVLSPAEGDLDHKSLLELWTSPAAARLFTRAELAAFRRHVPWTRLLGERRTGDADGRGIDLPAYARRARARLVLKPNRACGGEGVLIGRDTPEHVWERAIAAALSGRRPQVVQALVDAATLDLPTARGAERWYTTYGLLASPHGIGFLGRAAPFPVVNVSRGGGLLGVLLA